MEHGNIMVLLQPAELIIIGGAALGTVFISNPVHTLKQMISGVLAVFGSSKYSTQRYVDSLKMMYKLLQKARKEGLVRWRPILRSRIRVRCSLNTRISSRTTMH
jgi:chemotaxis protein MotA